MSLKYHEFYMKLEDSGLYGVHLSICLSQRMYTHTHTHTHTHSHSSHTQSRKTVTPVARQTTNSLTSTHLNHETMRNLVQVHKPLFLVSKLGLQTQRDDHMNKLWVKCLTHNTVLPSLGLTLLGISPTVGGRRRTIVHPKCRGIHL
jgi:hypothetical protein